MALSNSQQWWEEADFAVFFKELERKDRKAVVVKAFPVFVEKILEHYQIFDA